MAYDPDYAQRELQMQEDFENSTNGDNDEEEKTNGNRPRLSDPPGDVAVGEDDEEAPEQQEDESTDNEAQTEHEQERTQLAPLRPQEEDDEDDEEDKNNNNNNDNNESITIKILFFASARDAVNGLASTDLIWDEPPFDTAHLRMKLAQLFPTLADAVSNEEYLTLAVNEEYILAGQVLTLRSGDTVALIPPISGG